MAEPFNVVAIIHPLPGKRDEIIEAFRVVSPLVHQEKGCELYALQSTQEGEGLIVIERWSTADDLQAHATGAAMDKLNELNTDGIEPTMHVLEMSNVFREDVVQPSLDREAALANAPKTDGEYFLVPKILDTGDE